MTKNTLQSSKGIITAQQIELCSKCIDMAREQGASAVRVSLSKSIQNSISVLDGRTDKVSYSADCSMFFHIFADGKYGTFSTNRLEESELRKFITQAVQTTVLLAPDPSRSLPAPEFKATDCSEGDELGLYDASYLDHSLEQKMALALELGSYAPGEDYSIESVECEYSDNLDDNYMVDSEGFVGRHIETSYGFCTEATIMDGEGNRYSGYWWDGAPFLKDFDGTDVTAHAIKLAADQINPGNIHSGRMNVIVDRSCASRLVGPLLNALDGSNIQQKNSFLADSLDRMIFPKTLTINDIATQKGCPGSRLFDTEGLAVKECDIIREGVVKQYFINTYAGRLLGMNPTVEGVSRPCIRAHICNCDKKEIYLNDVLQLCGDGLYITGFNGGNCNSATGNFSFGVEGFEVRQGRIGRPVKEVVMTGSMIELWNCLKAACSDARSCTRWQIPTLYFENIEINA